MPDPSSVSGLILWTEDSGLYQDVAGTNPCASDGNPVQHWHDKSAAGNNLTEGTFNPLFHATGINSLHSVYETTANRVLRNDSLGNGLTDFTIFVVFKPGVSIANSERLIDKKYDTGIMVLRDGSNANKWAGKLFNDTPSALVLTLDDTQQHIIMYQRSGTTLNLMGDGETNQASFSGASATALGSDPFTTHAYYNAGSPNSGFYGDIGSVVFYNKALSTAERATVWNYLGPKWGVTLSGVGGGGEATYLPLKSGTEYLGIKVG